MSSIYNQWHLMLYRLDQELFSYDLYNVKISQRSSRESNTPATRLRA